MANDTDQLVVAHLREIHAQLQGVSTKLEEHDRRFDRTDRSLDGFRPLVELRTFEARLRLPGLSARTFLLPPHNFSFTKLQSYPKPPCSSTFLIRLFFYSSMDTCTTASFYNRLF